MFRHCIIMSSSYSDGKRIAYDIVGRGVIPVDEVTQSVRAVKERCGDDVSLSTHFIETDSKLWNSVRNYDLFFDEVELISSLDDFINKIQRDRILSGLDVASYILTRVSCTHLSLEKLVYFAYADYLCANQDKLFEDKIYAFKYGPVVKSVYEVFKGNGYADINPDNDPSCSITLEEMPAKSRILFAANGLQKLQSIDDTIGVYGEQKASFLVALTHQSGSPWAMTPRRKAYQEISDEAIKKYHHIESL